MGHLALSANVFPEPQQTMFRGDKHQRRTISEVMFHYMGARDFNCTTRQAVQTRSNDIQKVFNRYVSKSPESNLKSELQIPFFFHVALRLNAGYGLLIHEVFEITHTTRHSR
jgi:hypothetical protein